MGLNSSESASNKSPGKSSSGLTSFDVLLIIAILFVLLIFAEPYLSPAPPADYGRRAAAQNDVIQIATAIAGYQTEYGRLPSTNAEAQLVGGPVLQALVASNNTLNPRQIYFLEVGTARKGKGGIRDGVYVDPWGSPYKMKLNTNYTSSPTNENPSERSSRKTAKVVAVWNEPDTHSDKPNDKAKNRRYVKSWE